MAATPGVEEVVAGSSENQTQNQSPAQVDRYI